MKKLQALYNDDANKIVKQAVKEISAIENFNFLINLAIMTNYTKPAPEESQIFNEAWDHPNKSYCKKWQEVICKEFTSTNKQQVWCMTHKSLMPPNCRCVKSTKSCALVHTRCILGHAGTTWYPMSISLKTTLQ